MSEANSNNSLKPCWSSLTLTPTYAGLTARLSHDVIVAARQQLTTEWWEHRRRHFDLYTSEIVIQEARRGDEQAASKRLKMLQDIPQLDLKPETLELAELFLAQGAIPPTAREDAFQIAITITYGLDYLLTWHGRQIAKMPRFKNH